MKQQTNFSSARQQGIALPIVMVILVLAALIVLYMANTSRKEQQISADQYRTEQSLDAAMAAHDWAVDYYNSVGLTDADDNDVLDLYVPGADGGDEKALNVEDKADSSGSGASDLVLTARAFYCSVDEPTFWTDPENCNVAPDIGAEHVGVVAIGSSDDNTAHRVITVVLAGAPLLPPSGPGQPLTAKEGVDFDGGIIIINRYFNSNVWTGKKLTYSGTPETYIGDSTLPVGEARFDTSDAHRTMMIQSSKDDNAIPGALSGSSVKRGGNADVLENDPVLANLCTDCTGDRVDEFFNHFLNANKDQTQDAARGIGQFYATCAELTNDATPPTSGVIWVDESCDMDMDFGTFEQPAALFVNGDTGLDSNTRIYGLVYATGSLTAHGGAIVKGSVIVEGEFLTQGAGTMDLVYDAVAVGPGPGMIGRRSIVPGTWRDWGS